MKILHVIVIQKLILASLRQNVEWELQANNVCYGARNNDTGTFFTSKQGLFKAIRMKHVSGSFGCHKDPQYNSRWGCWKYIHTIITDNQRNIIFPDPKLVTSNNYYRFTVRGYDGKTSNYLTYVDLINPIYVERGTEMNIWYGEDLNDYTEQDNHGKHCVDVYAKITDDF